MLKGIDLNLEKSITDHPAWKRLNDQLNWYDGKSSHAQKYYKSLKFIQILLALFIPVFNMFDIESSKIFTAIAGAMIALLEGIQQMNQYSRLWVEYRSTAEKLKHEKYLFVSNAGRYKEIRPEEKLILLAETVEEMVSTEHANWCSETEKCIANTTK